MTGFLSQSNSSIALWNIRPGEFDITHNYSYKEELSGVRSISLRLNPIKNVIATIYDRLARGMTQLLVSTAAIRIFSKDDEKED
ncbi:hypothetical protein D1BOALGB6SA_1081 [Olavius sp. associated proteobacterium Delta 1]|nr:hypothetical protein D1BOALGB6SA_1081 [Olavius sp. associated proteobacterium Delta 1]